MGGESNGRQRSARCPACGAGQLEHLGHTLYYQSKDRREDVMCEVARCAQCSLLRQDVPLEALDGHFDNASYTSEANEANFRSRRRRLYGVITSRILPPPDESGKQLLDVGASYGHFMEAARDAGWRTFGVESVDACVEIARAEGLEVNRGFFPEAVSVDERFNVVTYVDSFYLMPDPTEALRATHRLLLPGGYLFLRVTNRAWLWRIARAFRAGGGLLPMWLMGDALFGFGPRSIRLILIRGGFTDVRVWSEPARTQPRSGRLVKGLYRLGDAARISTGDRLQLSPGLLVLARKGE